jgi:hypothetical protein
MGEVKRHLCKQEMNKRSATHGERGLNMEIWAEGTAALMWEVVWCES